MTAFGLGRLVIAGLLVAGLAIASPAVRADDDDDEDVDIDFDADVTIDIDKSISVTVDVNITGDIVVNGSVEVSETAMSLINNTQVINDGLVTLADAGADFSNSVTLGTDVLGSSNGNIGVNLSSGASILQENSVSLSTLSGGPGTSADAESLSLQQSLNNTFSPNSTTNDVVNTVQLLGDVLADATGNIGVNIAVGAFHAQDNSLALGSISGNTVLAQALANSVQEVSFGRTFHVDTVNSVTLGDNVLFGASGNIGLNITAGTNNLQRNTLVISSGQ